MMRSILVAIGILACVSAGGFCASGCGAPVEEHPPADGNQAPPEIPPMEAPPEVIEGTLGALPPAADPAMPDWQQLHLPLVVWDHYEALVSTIVLAMDAVRVNVPASDWLGAETGAPHQVAATLVAALQDRQKDAMLPLIRPRAGSETFPDFDIFWDALTAQYSGYGRQTFQLRFRMGGVEGFTVLFEEPAAPSQERRQVWTFPLMQDADSGHWQLGPDVLPDGRWGAVSAIVHEEFKNAEVRVPVLTPEEAAREHRIEFARLWGDRENLHPVAVQFNGGVPGPAEPELAELAREMGEIWKLFKGVLADFSVDDPSFRAFLEHLSPGSADFMKEFMTRDNETIQFWQTHRPSAEEVRFILDAGPLYIFFYPTMRDGPKDILEFLRGRIVDGKLILTNIGNDDYFSGILLTPAFSSRFMGLIRELEQEQERAAALEAKSKQQEEAAAENPEDPGSEVPEAVVPE